MVSRLVFLLTLSGLCFSSPLDEFEKEWTKEGLDLEKIHEELKRESDEVEEEFSGKDTQDTLAKLRSAYPSPSNGTIEEKTVLEINGDLAKDLFEGDIVLTPEQWSRALDHDNLTMTRRQALTDFVMMWTPMGAPIIPYTYEPDFAEDSKRDIEAALEFWEARTCIKFRPATPSDINIISFNDNVFYCASSVGMIGGKQTVELGYGCLSLSTIVHELSHTFGTLHVQSRSDRDNFVIIDSKNIQEGEEHNFAKEPPYYGRLDNYGIPYEFASVMHYDAHAFAINRAKPTIWAKLEYWDYQGSMEGPMATFYDTLLINKMYKCTDKCQTKISCQNNGVQDGADCNRCFCPKGWAGTYCEERPEDAILTILTTNQEIQLSIKGYGGFTENMYIIEAPAGKKISAVVESIGPQRYHRCRTAGLEIIPFEDTRINGFLFCGSLNKKPVVSESNHMVIWMWNELPIYTHYANINFTLV